ncbi:hypothetical protein [Streptomyces sp. DH8]|uniref:hypothetical protein n=1 Tax=Streptomyces sp. DH8 TaxID=2857008 RepID=UPI001E5B6320|nr:hypothetical protein [Streptomyces sp. DH8]
MSYTTGDRVQSDTGDLDVPDGTPGTVRHVYPDYADGIDVIFDDGQHRNVLACGLAPL